MNTSIEFYALKILLIIYDIITLPIYILLQKSWKTISRSSEIKAKPLSPSNPYSPWVSVRQNSQMKSHLINDCETLSQLFDICVENYRYKNCLGFRPVFGEQYAKEGDDKKMVRKLILGEYRWLTYHEIDIRVNNITKGLMKAGVAPGQNVLIFAETRLEWMLSALSIFRIGSVVVSLYTTLDNESVADLIVETEVKHIITSTNQLVKLKELTLSNTTVQNIIYFDDLAKPEIDGFNANIKVNCLSIIENSGKDVISLSKRQSLRNETAVLMLTSGTTGQPKVVKLSHQNILSAITSYLSIAIAMSKESDIYVALLPLAHVLELEAELVFMSLGIRIGYSSFDTLTDRSAAIMKGSSGDISLLKPTIMVLVPTVLDRLQKSIIEIVDKSDTETKYEFRFIMEYKKFWYNLGFKTPIMNTIIKWRTNAILGGEVRYIISCGAKLSPVTHEFIRTYFNSQVINTYGMTETSACATATHFNDLSFDHVGTPLPGVQIKLIDWKQGNYSVRDKSNPRGEIVIGGSNITDGYYKNDSLTEECIRVEDNIRWIYTGDIGEVLTNGNIKVIGRKNEMIKLNNSDNYISLSHLESQLKTCKFVENLCVVGHSNYSFLIAFVIPNNNAIVSLAKKFNKGFLHVRHLYKDPVIVEGVLEEIREYATKVCRLKDMEIPQKIWLCSDEWSVENGLITSRNQTKINRNMFKCFYKKEISLLYDECN